MANQLKMAEVQAIAALARNGWSDRRIARQLGVHRETVGRHRRLLEAGDSKPASAPLGSSLAAGGSANAADASEGVGSVSVGAPHGSAALVTGGSAQGHASTAGPWLETIIRKLEAGLTVRRIYQDLCSDHEYAGSYYSVRRLVKKLAAAAPAPFRRMECEAGAEAQVDFGRGAPIVSTEGKRKSTWVFRIVLSHSRKGYAEAVHR